MKSIVTGGAGFIGSHLVDRLVAEGHEVVVIDNLVTGKLENIAGHIENGSVEFHNIDVSDDKIDTGLFKDVDWVFHLAAMADIVPSIVEPAKYLKANIEGTWNVLELSREAGVKNFVYTASSSCYGIPDIYPTPETAPISPMYPYALSKYLGEELVLYWGKIYNMPVISLRLFNVFGPRHRTTGAYGAVFGVFLAQKLAGKPYTIVGDGEQTRDFTYVTDIADALITAAESDITGEIINIGSDGTYSVNDLVSLLEGPVIHIPKRPGEPDCTYADITKAKGILGWKPKVSFEIGVKETLNNIHLWQDAPVWTPETIAVATADWFKFLSENDDSNSKKKSG